MAVIKFITAATFMLHASSVLAIDLGGPIVGCAAVDCPSTSNSTSADCRVADRNSTVIGLANFQTSVVKDDLTWSQGVSTYDNVDPNVDNDRIYEKNFYLGLPQGLDLTANATKSGYGACALFFTQVTDRVKFGGDDLATSFGTCNDALTADCVNALLKQATDASGSFNSSSTADACKSLQSAFTDKLASQCSRAATGDKWQGLEGRGVFQVHNCSSAISLTDIHRSHRLRRIKTSHRSPELIIKLLSHASEKQLIDLCRRVQHLWHQSRGISGNELVQHHSNSDCILSAKCIKCDRHPPTRSAAHLFESRGRNRCRKQDRQQWDQ